MRRAIIVNKYLAMYVVEVHYKYQVSTPDTELNQQARNEQIMNVNIASCNQPPIHQPMDW